MLPLSLLKESEVCVLDSVDGRPMSTEKVTQAILKHRHKDMLIFENTALTLIFWSDKET